MIDITKQYRTRDGREVRIYATDGGGSGDSVHGAYKNGNNWLLCAWKQDGKYYNENWENHLDLIEVRPRHKRVVWVNAYADNTNAIFGSKEAADKKDGYRIACLHVELDFAEGDGL